MKFYSQLEEAALENLSSDPSNLYKGRIWYNTTDAVVRFRKDGTLTRAVLLNDSKLVLGNSGTAASNIRLHRGAASVLQFVLGDDATVEGTLSTGLAQISAKMEGYTDAGKPAAGNAGRIVYVTDLQTFLGDNGSSWVPLGGGGSGGSIKWSEQASAPQKTQINGAEAYIFEDTDSPQYLYTFIKVPQGYTAGRQIRLRSLWSTALTSGNILFQTLATLIRVGTDPSDDTTNQRTSTNAATTVNVVANVVTALTCDLTDASGQINSVAVSPGDLILVRMTRDCATDTGAGPAYLAAELSEVTYV